MELSDFISNTITSIMKGITDAEDGVQQYGAIVCPSNVHPTPETYSGSGVIGTMRPKEKPYRAVRTIDFDVAVTASEGTEKKGGIGIAVATLGLGVQNKTDSHSESISRIKFSIPVAYPENDV